MKKYKFRENSPYKKENAALIGKFIEENFPNGNPNPKEILEIARSTRSPIHKYFDWDDTAAAEKYRISQARDLITALYVEIDGGPRMRAYEKIRLEENGPKQFLSLEQIAQAPSLVSQVVERAKSDLLFWKTKNENYKEFFPATFKAIDVDVTLRSKDEKTKTSRSRKDNNDSSDRNKGGKGNSRRRLSTSGL